MPNESAAVAPDYVIKSLDQYIQTFGKDTQVNNGALVLTENLTNDLGSGWSRDDATLDFNESFRMRASFFTGTNTNFISERGIAFLIQAKTPKMMWLTQSGRSLGYLSDEGRGIPNSLAIEMDYSKTGKDFNNGIPYNHIAYTWPGRTDSYKFVGKELTLQHHNLKQENFTVGSWYNFVMSWDKETQKFYYQINNGEKFYVPYEELYENVISINNEAYWGVTGSTDHKWQMQIVNFQELPGLLNIDSTISVKNKMEELKPGSNIYTGEELTISYKNSFLSGKQDWFNITANLKIPPKLQVKETRVILRDQGKETVIPIDNKLWTNGKLMLDKEYPNLGVSPSIQEVEIIIDATVEEQVIDGQVDIFTGTYNGLNGQFIPDAFVIKYQKSLPPQVSITSDSNSSVIKDHQPHIFGGNWSSQDSSPIAIDYYIDGVLLNEQSDIKHGESGGQWNYVVESFPNLKSGPHTFEVKATNSGGKTASDKITFYLMSPPLLQSLNCKNELPFYRGESLLLTAEWLDKDSEFISFYYQIDDNEKVKIKDELNITPNNTSVLEFDISTENLNLGSHQLTLLATDSDGHESKTINYSFELLGHLSFSSKPKDIQLTNIKKTNSHQFIKATDIGEIGIIDSRDPGNTWRLNLSLSEEFKDNNNKIVKNFMYYKNNNNEKVLINKSGDDIIIHTTTSSKEVVVNQSGDSGFYFDVKPWMTTGIYRTSLKWELVDAP